jgi:Flp pilus assembly protein TadG
MRSLKLEDHNLLRDIRGSVLVETTIVLPMLLLLVLGTIDVTNMFYEWALANKAAYLGARTAATSNPVDPAMANLVYTSAQLENIGQSCLVVSCPSPNSVCTGAASGGSCTSGTFQNNAFTRIFDPMQRVFPRLQRQNLTISYQANGTGVVGQTWEGSVDPGNPQFTLPMNVTVSITGMTHQFYFVSPLLRFFGGGISATPTIPTFATTLQSEDLFTN